MLLKVCGLKEQENLDAVLSLQPYYVGFIFQPSSPRYFLNAIHPAELSHLNSNAKKVGVFVNEEEQIILNLIQSHALDIVQLHGDESLEFCKSLNEKGVKIIKVFRIHPDFDFSVVENYAPYIELFLFDTAGKHFGGNGVSFNWDILSQYRFSKPFLLSGGIGPENISQLLAFHHPDMIGVDVNSKFEISPGVKNVDALRSFKQQIS